MTFGNWPDELLHDSEQKKRMVSAASTKTKPQSIDTLNQSGTFVGSAATPYTTTLNTCTCVDFIRRKLPCKHMYRLASELGLFVIADWVDKGALEPPQIALADAVAEIENLSDDCQLFIKDLIDIERAVFVVSENDKELLSCSFLMQESLDAHIIMNRLSKKEIVEALNTSGYTPEKSLKKDDLIAWSIANIPDVATLFPGIVNLCISPSIKKIRRALSDYLRRKYDWTHCYFESESQGTGEYLVPAYSEYAHCVIDAENQENAVCSFPEDEITELLTFYGHNRCLNGFVPRRIEQEGIFSGKRVAITGLFNNMTRQDVSMEIITRGGRVTEWISKNTDFLVVGHHAGAKLQTAVKKSVKTLDEHSFLLLIR